MDLPWVIYLDMFFVVVFSIDGVYSRDTLDRSLSMLIVMLSATVIGSASAEKRLINAVGNGTQFEMSFISKDKNYICKEDLSDTK